MAASPESQDKEYLMLELDGLHGSDSFYMLFVEVSPQQQNRDLLQKLLSLFPATVAEREMVLHEAYAYSAQDIASLHALAFPLVKPFLGSRDAIDFHLVEGPIALEWADAAVEARDTAARERRNAYRSESDFFEENMGYSKFPKRKKLFGRKVQVISLFYGRPEALEED